MAAAETARLIASLELQDKNFTRGLKGAEKRLGRIDKKLGAFSGAVNRNVARGIDTLVTKGIDAGQAVIQAAIDQESAIVGIRKTVNGNIDGIVEDLKKLSIETGTTFEELASIAETGGAMGIAGDDIAAFTKQVAILGATTNVSIDDAATAIGQMGAVIGLTGDEFDNFAATLVDLGNKGNSTEAQILEIAKRSGGAAKLIGIAKDETLAWASAAANLGLGEELAGTAVQKFFIDTQKIIARGGKDLTTLADTAGMTAKQFKKAFQKDATGALAAFVKGLKGLSAEQATLRIEDLFGRGSGMTRLLIGLAGALNDPTSGLTASLENANTAWEAGTAAQTEADKRFKSSEFAFKRLNNAVNLAAATIGTELLPVLVELAEEGIDWLMKPATQKALKDFAVNLGKGIKGLVSTLKGMDWGAIAGFLGTAAGFAGELVKWFQKMPGWAQAFLVGGFVATRLPVIGDLLSGLASGLIKGVLGINAGVVNLKAATVVGGGAPVGGGGGGGGGKGIFGKLGSGLKIIGAVSIASASIVALAEAWGEFQTTVTESQTDLQEKVNATNQQNFKQTLDNLNATNKNLERMNGFQEIIASGFGGGQITQDFEMAADRIRAKFEAGQLTREDMVAALGPLADATKQGKELNLDIPKTNSLLSDLITAVNKGATKTPTKPGGAPGAFRPPPAAAKFPTPAALRDAVEGGTAGIKTAVAPLPAALRDAEAKIGNVKNAVATLDANQKASAVAAIATAVVSQVQQAAAATTAALNAAAQTGAIRTGTANTTTAARNAGTTTANAMTNAANRIVGAVNALDLSVNVTTVNRTSTVNNRYGPSGGSSTTGRTPSSYHG